MPTLGAIMPALPVRNLDAALALYCEKLGFAVRHRMDGGGGAIIVRDDAELHLTLLNDESWRARPDLIERPIKSGAESFLPGTASLRIRVDGVRALYAECAANCILHPRGRCANKRGARRTSASRMSTATCSPSTSERNRSPVAAAISARRADVGMR